MAGRVDGLSLALIAAGSLTAYSGFKGYSIPHALQSFVTGKVPSGPPQYGITGSTGTGSGSGSGSPVADTGSAQSILQNTAATFGWTGSEWTALSNVENREAGFSTTAKNPTSGALGMAQALGHGNASTGGTLGNEYGGYGLSDAQAQQANSGDAAMQSLWMCNYIQQTYQTPSAAWAHEQSQGWY